MYFMCHLTLRDHIVERACEHMGGNSLCFVTTLTNLVIISIVMVEISFQFDMWPSVNTRLKGYVNLFVEARHGETPSCHA